MITARVLPVDEWTRLDATDLGAVRAILPATTRVIAIEDDGRLVACVTGMLFFHGEGLWIHPDYRKRASVWRQLVAAFWRVAGEFGCEAAWTAAISDDMRDVLQRLGARALPGDHFILAKESRVCRSH